MGRILYCLMIGLSLLGLVFPKALVAGEQVNREVVQSHIFSDAKHADTFKLIYNQNNFEDTVWFQIANNKGEIISNRWFWGWALYSYDRPWYEFETSPSRDKVKFKSVEDSLHIYDSLRVADNQYLMNRFKTFFNEKNFRSNPVPEIYKNDRNLLKVGHYEDLLNDPSVVAFSIYWASSSEMIAWSKKKKQVVTFFESD